MNPEDLRCLLEDVRTGVVSPAQGVERLGHFPFADLGFARVDHHRGLRQRLPEVVFGEGKSFQQIAGIAREILDKHQRVLVTRVDGEKAAQVRALMPELEHNAMARTLRCLRKAPTPLSIESIAVVTAGTSDLPVAEEALETLDTAGVPVTRLFDAGVAGIHRLLADLPTLERAPAVIVVAGMEGALPSVVGGLIRRPVIAVPTSVGYGAALSGFTALLGMLTSCASGIVVVNIDNGFGAAMAVLRLVDAMHRESAT